MAVPRITIITPMFNEEASFGAYVEAVERILLSRTDAHYDILFIDDGSTDRTWKLMEAQCRVSGRYRALRLSRNFGAHAAETAGLDCCDAEAVATLPADLQDPPETIVTFVKAWSDGADIVWGHRRSRAESWQRAWASKFFASLLRRFAMPRGSKFTTGGFFLIDRKVVECVRQFREQSRLTFGIVAWTGFRQEIVQYDRQERLMGKSNWSYSRMVIAMYDALIGFSYAIPRMVTMVGVAFSLVGFLAAGLFLLNAILSHPVPGWSGIMITLMLFFGITFLILGIICEYLMRIYREAVQRPIYFIAEDTAGQFQEARALKKFQRPLRQPH